jgi:lysophospholipase L1-like esterase
MFTPRLFLSAVLVAGSASASTVVAFGDSITDGASASVDGNQRWPDLLARRLAPYRVGAVNAGISGNQLLQEVSALGNNGVARFERDALSRPGVKAVIVLIGINDIGNGGFEGLGLPTPGALIAGYRQLIAQARCRGIRILGGTLTPYEDALKGVVKDYYTPEKALVWSSVNDWIRSSGEFDDVVDFDKALRDPEQPTRLLPAYDSGDRLHPNDAGDRALAEAVDLTSLLHTR